MWFNHVTNNLQIVSGNRSPTTLTPNVQYSLYGSFSCLSYLLCLNEGIEDNTVLPHPTSVPPRPQQVATCEGPTGYHSVFHPLLLWSCPGSSVKPVESFAQGLPVEKDMIKRLTVHCLGRVLEALSHSFAYITLLISLFYRSFCL